MATTTITLNGQNQTSSAIPITAGNIMISSSLLSKINKASVRLLQEKQTAGQYMPIVEFSSNFSEVFQLNTANYKLELYGVDTTDTLTSIEINIVT